MEYQSCIEVLQEALHKVKTDIVNTHQGPPVHPEGFTGTLETEDTRISMDGCGRAVDNIISERIRTRSSTMRCTSRTMERLQLRDQGYDSTSVCITGSGCTSLRASGRLRQSATARGLPRPARDRKLRVRQLAHRSMGGDGGKDKHSGCNATF